MKKYLKYVAIVIAIPVLAACGERYRYPCQDPKNWGEEYCKKPFCSANGTCPEDLTHYEKSAQNRPMPTPAINTGGCK